jgi:hypothetical protein
LAPSFSGVGFAAHNIPKPKKREKEMMRKTRIDLLKFDFILPPKLHKNDSPIVRMEVISTKFKFLGF